jgi:hypothetical protein
VQGALTLELAGRTGALSWGWRQQREKRQGVKTSTSTLKNKDEKRQRHVLY